MFRYNKNDKKWCGCWISQLFIFTMVISYFCKQLCYTLLEEAKISRQYDTLAFSYIRIGICTNDAQLIQNGLSLAKLVEDEHLLTELEREVDIFVNKKESHWDFLFYIFLIPTVVKPEVLSSCPWTVTSSNISVCYTFLVFSWVVAVQVRICQLVTSDVTSVCRCVATAWFFLSDPFFRFCFRSAYSCSWSWVAFCCCRCWSWSWSFVSFFICSFFYNSFSNCWSFFNFCYRSFCVVVWATGAAPSITNTWSIKIRSTFLMLFNLANFSTVVL